MKENFEKKQSPAGKAAAETAMSRALIARAKESKRANHYIYDKKALEIVERLEYDLSADTANVMGRGAMARMILLDKMVGDYVKKNPTATIINLACGADTRFFRVDNGAIRWYNLDLPATIDERKRLFGDEGDRVSYISKSAMDESWAQDVKANTPGSNTSDTDSAAALTGVEGPILIIAESLSMYLTKQEVQKIFKIIRMHFEQADIFMEVTAPYVVEKAIEGSGENSRPKYTFGVQNGKKLQEMITGFKAVKSVTLMAGLKKMFPSYHVLQFMPTMRKMSNKIVVLKRTDADPYGGMGIK